MYCNHNDSLELDIERKYILKYLIKRTLAQKKCNACLKKKKKTILF